MTGLEKVTTEATAEITSEAAKQTAGLIKNLFGKAFEEAGAIWQDNIRYRRYKNQIKILNKAAEHIKKQGIDPQKVNLKVLAPLIDYCSLEEDESLQTKWSNLIKNILSKPLAVSTQQNCIEVLNKISNEEAQLLDKIYAKFLVKRLQKVKQLNNRWPNVTTLHTSPDKISVNEIIFQLKDLKEEFKIQTNSFDTQISNLILLGTLEFHTSLSIHSLRKSSTDPEDDNIDLDMDVHNHSRIGLTKFGINFIEFCK